MSGRVIFICGTVHPFIEHVGYLIPVLSCSCCVIFLRPNTVTSNSRMLHGMRYFKGDG